MLDTENEPTAHDLDNLPGELLQHLGALSVADPGAELTREKLAVAEGSPG